MTKKLKTLSISVFLTFAVFFLMGIVPFGVSAAGSTTSETGAGGVNEGTIGICTFIGPICNALGINSAENATGQVIGFTQTRLQQIVSLLFIGIIIISVFIIVQAGVKYIQSQGEEGKIAEAQKAIRSVFIGIAVLFVGIIGLILVLAFFNASGLVANQEDINDVFNVPEE